MNNASPGLAEIQIASTLTIWCLNSDRTRTMTKFFQEERTQVNSLEATTETMIKDGRETEQIHNIL